MILSSNTSPVLDEKVARMAYIIMHPVRYRIARMLMKKPMYVAEIAREFGDVQKYRKLITHHLLLMSKYGLVKSRYAPKNGPPFDERGRPVIVNYFSLTKEAKEILKKINL